ncbi:OmpH family outer membrane protein [Sinomicrobium weinanense]|uniref:OmpH family outer membrane protein n=1 Tax=Sinomicrobium weinanense TaxID=2842200 RepID=A0A926Q379_9FLAO|nr:OmpH family outer membrane protein [Sinomicrobium weinanense]MBC9797288.1 OmpH family outer membrane protein [Sinomicrobium weinanense]MBU3125421.1 OmpH family outer membrane protein [Sinomicrobium weinanense]
MKKIVIAGVALLGLLSCQQNKIAFVDNTTLINDYQEKKDVESKFQVKLDSFQKKTDSLSQALQAEAQQFQAEASKMAQSKAEKRYGELMQKRQQIQQQVQQEEMQLQQDSQGQIDSLVKKVRNFIKEYGKNNGYTYILGANEAGSVLYGEETKDITEELLKALNDKYKEEK